MNTNHTFTIIYSFKVIEGKQNDFIHAWTELTKLIYTFADSYGSRLHKTTDGLFIAYAQWTDKETWESSGDKLPESADELRKKLRECCSEIKIEHELYIVQDLLNNQKHKEA